MAQVPAKFLIKILIKFKISLGSFFRIGFEGFDGNEEKNEESKDWSGPIFRFRTMSRNFPERLPKFQKVSRNRKIGSDQPQDFLFS